MVQGHLGGNATPSFLAVRFSNSFLWFVEFKAGRRQSCERKHTHFVYALVTSLPAPFLYSAVVWQLVKAMEMGSQDLPSPLKKELPAWCAHRHLWGRTSAHKWLKIQDINAEIWAYKYMCCWGCLTKAWCKTPNLYHATAEVREGIAAHFCCAN